MCSRHESPESEQLVCAASASSETALTLSKGDFGLGFETVQDHSGEHLTGDTKKGYALIVVAVCSVALLMQGDDNLLPPITRYGTMGPDGGKQRC